MVEPVDGKIIYPHADRMWARSVNNEVKLIRITDYTRIFLDEIEDLHIETGLKLTDVHTFSVIFPELFFEDPEHGAYVWVFYKDECWNMQTDRICLNGKAMKKAVVPFLEFLDKDAGRVDYKMVKEYLGLKDEEEEE